VLGGEYSVEVQDCSFQHCTLVATNCAAVMLKRVDFQSSVHHGPGISIYSYGACVDMIKCTIEGGWQGIASHQDGELRMSNCECRDTHLIGLEVHSQVPNITSLHDCKFDCTGLREAALRQYRLDQNKHLAPISSSVGDDVLSVKDLNRAVEWLPEGWRPDMHGMGMAYGAIFLHGKGSRALLEDSAIADIHLGVHVRDAGLRVDGSGVGGWCQGLAVTHGGHATLDDAEIGSPAGPLTVEDQWGSFVYENPGMIAVRASGSGSEIRASTSTSCSSPVIAQDGAAEVGTGRKLEMACGGMLVCRSSTKGFRRASNLMCSRW
jgi:hypothetical protein